MVIESVQYSRRQSASKMVFYRTDLSRQAVELAETPLPLLPCTSYHSTASAIHWPLQHAPIHSSSDPPPAPPPLNPPLPCLSPCPFSAPTGTARRVHLRKGIGQLALGWLRHMHAKCSQKSCIGTTGPLSVACFVDVLHDDVLPSHTLAAWY